jgi:hypothetical protein
MRDSLGWALIFGLALVTLLLPMVLYRLLGPIPAVIAGVGLPLIWGCAFPTTCLSGNFGFSAIAMWQFTSALCWFLFMLLQVAGFLLKLILR